MVLATSTLLAVRRRFSEAIVLVLGFALIVVAVHLTKAGIDRPRPEGVLIGTSGSSFPSGHAAYSTVWIAAALLITRRLGLVGYAALVTVAIVLAAAIGLSRIYLHAHYWSDVAAGWGLGVGIFGVLSAIAMIVDHMRHNGRERAPTPTARAER